MEFTDRSPSGGWLGDACLDCSAFLAVSYGTKGGVGGVGLDLWAWLHPVALKGRDQPGYVSSALVAWRDLRLCVLDLWTKREQSKSYFDPQLSWFQGLPRPIPQLQAKLVGLDETALPSPLAVCRLDEEGLFAFSQQGQIVPHVDVELELFHGNLLDERKIRLKGRVVRQFESRVCQGRSRDWGIGVQWSPMTPDSKKDFQDFLEVLRGEGYV